MSERESEKTHPAPGEAGTKADPEEGTKGDSVAFAGRLREFVNAVMEYNISLPVFEEDPAGKYATTPLPLLKLDAPLASISRLLRFFGPRLLNENLNCLLVSLADDATVTAISLFLEDEHGNYIKQIPVDADLLGGIPADWSNLERVYDQLKNSLTQAMGMEVGFLLLVRPPLVAKLAQIEAQLPKYPDILHVIDILARTFHEVVKNGALQYYPRLKVVDLLEKLTGYYGKTAIHAGAELLKQTLPEFDVLVSLLADDWALGARLVSKNTTTRLSFLDARKIDAISPRTLEELPGAVREAFEIETQFEKLKTFSVTLRAAPLASFLEELADSTFPPSAERSLLLASKVLFGYRSFEALWNIAPYPLSQNAAVRFLLRVLGFNFNIKKISYWAFPILLYEYAGFFVGKTERFALVYCDQAKGAPLIDPRGFGLTLQDGFLRDVTPLPEAVTEAAHLTAMEYKQHGYNHLCKQLKADLLAAGTFVNRVIVVQRAVARRVVKNVLFDINSTSPFRWFRLVGTIRRLKNSKKFASYPVNPLFLKFTDTGSVKQGKQLLKLLVDKHEF